MLSDFLHDQAVSYVTGSLPPSQREQFELLLEFDDELRALTRDLIEVGAALTLCAPRLPGAIPAHSQELKARLSKLVSDRPQFPATDGIVVASPEGLVQWVNPAFSDLCGYTPEEVRGKKLGPILQGVDTDPDAATQLRLAVQERRPCKVTILNYHKDGSSYWVDVDMAPFLDDTGTALYLLARERELTDRPTP